MIIAAADGSSLNNPGPAGWAWFIDENNWAADGWPMGTNNQGELKAVLNLLYATQKTDQPLKILCDSQYVINTLTKWMPGWKRKGWRKADGKPVQNVELIMALDQALAGRQVSFEWVKGHAGHDMNEAADQRARAAATAISQHKPVDNGPGFALAATNETKAVEKPRIKQCEKLADQSQDGLFDMPQSSSAKVFNELDKHTTNIRGEMKIAFLGCGNMGEAMLAAVIASGFATAQQIAVNTRTQATMDRIAKQYGVMVSADKNVVVAGAKLIVLAVEPIAYRQVIAQVVADIDSDAVLLSIAPNFTLAELAQMAPGIAIARAMPNTPARIRRGVSAVCFDDKTSDAQREMVVGFLESFGIAAKVEEHQMNAVVGVAGSAPAFIYTVIEAIAQGGISLGLPAKLALELACATTESAAALLAHSGKHPAQLRDEVCSPGGTTITGIVELEKNAVPAGIIQAVRAAGIHAGKMKN